MRTPSGGEAEARVAKEAAWQASLLEWGAPGVMVTEGGEVVAFALAGPALAYRRVRQIGPPASPDAHVLATAWVADDARPRAVEALMQSVLRAAARAGLRGVEAYADRLLGGSARPSHTTAGCALSEAFLRELGFAVHREHHRYPLLRLDLRQTVRWQPAVGEALRGVARAAHPRPRPVRPPVLGAAPQVSGCRGAGRST